jgi:hypothetical protein
MQAGLGSFSIPGAALEPVRRELYATAALMLVGAAIPLTIRPP